MGILWLWRSLGAFASSHLPYWAALAWGVPVTLLICGTVGRTYHLAVWVLMFLVLRIGTGRPQ